MVCGRNLICKLSEEKTHHFIFTVRQKTYISLLQQICLAKLLELYENAQSGCHPKSDRHN